MQYIHVVQVRVSLFDLPSDLGLPWPQISVQDVIIIYRQILLNEPAAVPVLAFRSRVKIMSPIFLYFQMSDSILSSIYSFFVALSMKIPAEECTLHK